MRSIIFYIFFTVVCYNFTIAQSLSIQTYCWYNAPPWANPDILPDSVKVNYDLSKLDSVEFKLIRGFNRFNPEEKGPNYFEEKLFNDKNGLVKINLSKLKDGDVFIISAFKNKYIRIWNTFKYNKGMNNSKWIAYLIPLKPINSTCP